MERDLRLLFSEYLTKFKTMAVATSSKEGVVDCATVYFAVGDQGRIYFATTTGTVKLKNIEMNSSVAACFSDDGLSATGLQVRGTVQEVTNKIMVTAIRSLLKGRDPRIAAYLERPDIRVFEITPKERFLINFAWGVDWRNAVPAD
jgi:pyridoxine/pyridoxamine 5'-phosphate oxidase